MNRRDRLKSFIVVEIIFFTVAAPFIVGMEMFRTREPCEDLDTVLQGQIITTHPPLRDTWTTTYNGKSLITYDITSYGESSFYVYMSWDSDEMFFSKTLQEGFDDWFVIKTDINGIVDICVING